jgi:hypothetical protein
MNHRVIVRALVAAAALIAFAFTPAVAGGPMCPPPMCPPPMCAPAPMCGPAPCAPPMCCPPPCAPEQCEPGPLAQILRGAARLVVGVVSLPFRMADCLFGDDCFVPRRECRQVVACAPPPMCAPCGPMMGYAAPPAYGFGMAPGRPVGMGQGAPRRFVPFSSNKSRPACLMAGAVDGVFGEYW